jgi:hypothetical protein
MRSLLLLFIVGFLAAGCATSQPKSDGGAVGAVIREATAPADSVGKASDAKHPTVSSLPVEVWGQRLKNSKFDYPVVINPAVEHWITYFTGKGRRFFDKYLERSRYFIPTIAKVLKGHNMPQDLVYLAMIESGFNNSAKSRARAVGPWQFIRQTGQRYGLTVDYWLDERRDTRKATLAAIAYLKELYQEFGSWELAAAGYNAGENKVRRAISKYRSGDFWEIARHRFFRRETRDYVPKIIAAAILTKNAEQFGFTNPFNGHGPKNPTLMNDEPGDEVTPKELGEPAVKTDEASDDPADKSDDSSDDSSTADDDEDQDAAALAAGGPNPAMSPAIYMVANPNEQILEFEIKGPADLFAVSKAAGIPFSTVKTLNPELLRWCTPPTMHTYRVKLPLSVKDRFLATYNDESFDRRVVFMRYTIKRGDTVQKVAKRFGVEAPPIREINQIDLRRNDLRAGSQISLPIPTGYKRVIASMYDERPEKASRRRRGRRIRRHRRSSSAAHHQQQRLRPNVAAREDT